MEREHMKYSDKQAWNNEGTRFARNRSALRYSEIDLWVVSSFLISLIQ